MTQQDDATSRAALRDEQVRLQREIAELTRGDQAAFPSVAEDASDEPAGDAVDQAETLENDERNQAVVEVLRARLQEVTEALARMGDADNHS
jgi:RNA polymerase-binding transcription factor DksA